MARKDVVAPYPVVTAPQSLASAFTSQPTMITYYDNCCYQILVTTSDSTGSFFVQGSLDYSNGPVANSGTWTDLTLSGTPTVNAANDSILINLNQIPFNALRIRYSPTNPGTGTCSILVSAKQIGG